MTADLEQLLLENIEDDATWQVYGDYLQSQGDIRGELVNLEYALKTADNEKAIKNQINKLINTHKEALAGKAIFDLLQIKGIKQVLTLEWKRGFIDFLRIDNNYDWENKKDSPDVIEILDIILTSTAGKFLTRLNFGLAPGLNESGPDFSIYINALTQYDVLPTIRELYIGDCDYQISWTHVGNIQDLYEVVPELHYLYVYGAEIYLGNLSHPKLKKLVIETGGLPQQSVDSINNADLPNLEHLEVYFGSSDYGAEGEAKDLTNLLAGEGYPKLTYLGLLNAEFTHDILELILNANILPRLKILDLSLGTLMDKGAEIFIDNKAKFQHLEKININDNFLSESMIENLRNTFENTEIYTEEQKDADDYDEDEDDEPARPYLYVSVGE